MFVEGSSPSSSELHASANEILSYGNGFCGVEVTKDTLASLLSRGLIPEIWLDRASNGSFDAVCFTVIPAGPQASQRFAALRGENHFADDLSNPERPSYQQPDAIILGVIADLQQIAHQESVQAVRANGRFPADLYPTTDIPGVEPRSLEKSRRGKGGGWTGEVRVYFNPTENKTGIAPQNWKGIVVKEGDLPVLRQWTREIRASHHLKIKPLPLFSPEMQHLGST